MEGFRFTLLQDSMSNEQAYVELGLNCADICEALDQGLDGKGLDDLSQSARDAVNRLTKWVAFAVRSAGSIPMTRLITEPLRRFKERLQGGAGAAVSPDSSIRVMIGRRLPLGS